MSEQLGTCNLDSGPHKKDEHYVKVFKIGKCKNWQPVPAPAEPATIDCHCKTLTGVGGSITRGTGRLDMNGYWSNPCPHGNAISDPPVEPALKEGWLERQGENSKQTMEKLAEVFPAEPPEAPSYRFDGREDRRKWQIRLERINAIWAILVLHGKEVAGCATADDLPTAMDMAKELYEGCLEWPEKTT